MSFKIETTFPTNALDAWLAGLQKAKTAFLESFGERMKRLTDETFDALAHGGRRRGVYWPPFRREPPASRGGRAARLLDDTGKLRSSIGELFSVRNNRMRLGTRAPYAARQQAMRPFLFFETPRDADDAAQIAAEFIARGFSNSNPQNREIS